MNDADERLDDDLVVVHTVLGAASAYVLMLRGETHSWNAPMLEDHVERAIAHGTAVILDCGALRFADAHLLRLLLHTRARRRLVLVGPLSEAFTQRLAVTGTTDLFPVAPTLTRALAAINS
ncbi:STAS domain-containing protein [Streptomyces sp. NPDC059819]|uniref:STAS domain-containing protein n=1 Tax=Streptomyces sp. NPDC059819 TaxID=3346963 RepID=UPI003657E1A2